MIYFLVLRKFQSGLKSKEQMYAKDVKEQRMLDIMP